MGSCCLRLHVAKSLTSFKLCATELPTTCNRVCKRAQQKISNNVASVCTGLTLYYVVNSKNRRDESKQVSFHQFRRVDLLEVLGWFQAFQRLLPPCRTSIKGNSWTQHEMKTMKVPCSMHALPPYDKKICLEECTKEQIQNLPFPSLHQKCCRTLEGEFLYIFNISTKIKQI